MIYIVIMHVIQLFTELKNWPSIQKFSILDPSNFDGVSCFSSLSYNIFFSPFCTKRFFIIDAMDGDLWWLSWWNSRADHQPEQRKVLFWKFSRNNLYFRLAFATYISIERNHVPPLRWWDHFSHRPLVSFWRLAVGYFLWLKLLFVISLLSFNLSGCLQMDNLPLRVEAYGRRIILFMQCFPFGS